MSDPTDAAADGGNLIYRQCRPVRLWHWINAISVIVMLMSGLAIFNAHPQLYWGQYGANHEVPWFEIGSSGSSGFLRLGPITIPTTGVLGISSGNELAFPALVTIPSSYDLATARQWHFAFAWLLVGGGLLFWLWGFVSRHVQRDLAPTRRELRPAHIWQDIKDHARLRFHTGEGARRYNILQKLSYIGVIFGLLPAMVLSGLTMSPSMDAAWPWLLDLLGGRQSARSIHFICASLLVGFILVHLAMVLLAGPFNELRSIITGWYRLPRETSR
ncbi:thiosulfate reductase cytochrome b subunit [Sphingomonas vulcanisoli]|uniref:Thiosulfate reductase cytochrome b subunit n=1 Tax=Sphingomonas vulcanisoli TaxID=1658060 RepID=A0ABX0TVT9_9SPHN|nr:cytochrome b/b6 domain-containing protein [Sphingomonas vulcanisoli]NIJ09546.1 thiosulfate reductase cytochrome b subunit [Sphingomonas vulcanisoli]